MFDRALHKLTIAEAGAMLRQRALSSVELTQAALERIGRLEPSYNAFVTVTAERAMADARRADAAFAAGEDGGAMQGIPYALKDLIDTGGIRTTANSKLLLDNVPAEDAIVAARLRRAGGILLGKLSTYEFALDGPSYDLPFPPSRNPHNVAHIPGGSSSGPAAAVAAGFVRLAIGTDTGGSIRSPAGYCGIVGLKPTFGLVSCQGIHPLSPSLDHAGPLAATVSEVALGLDIIAGDARHDAGGAQSKIGQDVRRLRLGYARSFHLDSPEITGEVAMGLDDAASQFSLLGMEIEEIELPDYFTFETCGKTILQAEAFAVHQEALRRCGQAYGRLARQALAAGAGLTADDLAKAQEMRASLAARLNQDIFTRFDAILCANVLTTAPRFDAFTGMQPRWTAMRTLPFNVTGHPALALPVGTGANNLPLSVQIIGKPFDEASLCQIGAAYEAASHWGILPL